MKGFQLIELLFVLAIIAIIATIATPSYFNHFVTERRIEAKTQLLLLSAALEEYYLQQHSYVGATIEKLHIQNKLKDYYQFEIEEQTQQQYSLMAIPLGQQAINDKQCGILKLNALGEWKFSGNNTLNC